MAETAPKKAFVGERRKPIPAHPAPAKQYPAKPMKKGKH